MYSVDPPLPIESLDPGTYYVAGPPLSQKDRLVRELLVSGLDDGENGLLISTDRSAEAVERELANLIDPVPTNFGVVDCISEQSGGPGEGDQGVAYASSPGDLTGIGMYASRHLQRFDEMAPSPRTRVALDSVSTLLMYEEFQTVLRFLHVLSGRLEVVNALGLFVINTETHEDQVTESILELADGVIEVREQGSTGQVRVVSAQETTEWREF